MSDPYSTDLQHSQPNPADRLKVGHLVAGLVLVGIAGAWALRAADLIGPVDPGPALAVVLVAAGVIGLAAMVTGNRRRASHRPTQPDPVDETDTHTDTDTKEIDR